MDVQNGFPYQGISNDLGDIITWERICADIYYVSVQDKKTGLPDEYYAFPANTVVLSEKAKLYGAELPGCPEICVVILGSTGSGSTVVHYETVMYKIRNGFPLENGENIFEIAAYGKEENPEYFGRFPAPVDTPYGPMLRYMELAHGIFSVETEKDPHLLAVAYPIWFGDLTDYAKQNGILLQLSISVPTDAVPGYMFFPEAYGSIALFELMQTHEINSEVVDCTALTNHIFLNHPEYALHHNRREAVGLNDGSAAMHSMLDSVDHEPEPEENLIAWNNDAGTEYLHF